MSADLTVYALHALGGSGAAFAPVADELAGFRGIRIVTLDLPGFGDEAAATGYDVAAMADHVIARIRRDGAARWALLGHSMGGKVASVVARRALAGDDPVFGLAGVVLLAASPPVPEPMGDDKRAEMIGWARSGGVDTARARAFIDDNTARPLPPALDAQAVSDLRRAVPDAWAHWFERGSREDVSGLVGVLDVPAVIVAGAGDADLGADAQPRLHGAVYPRARFVRLPETGHLVPQERPREVAAAIAALRDEIDAHSPAVPEEWARLIAGPTVAPRVRATLAARAIPDDPDYRPRVLTAAQLATLRRFADLVVPQPGSGRIDLAARLDRQLAASEGDGWRPASLPPDAVAARLALDALALVGLDAGAVAALRAGELDIAASALSPAQLQAWAEDATVDLARHWLAHPASLARTGNDSFATRGGDGSGLPARGFTALGAGARDAWEPAGLGAVRNTAPAPASSAEGAAS